MDCLKVIQKRILDNDNKILNDETNNREKENNNVLESTKCVNYYIETIFQQ